MNKPLSSLVAILCGIMAVCGITPNAHAANDAAKLLEQSAAKIKTAKSVDVAYTLKSGNTDVKGTLLLSGNKFYAVNNAMTAWYDGTTQWTYSPATCEVNIIEPTDEELAATNPLAIMSSLKNKYTSSIIKSSPGFRTILLKSINKSSDWPQITITLKSSTLLPTSIAIKGRDGSQTVIAISSLQIRNTTANESVFKFDRKKYPKAKIVDLR